MADTGASVVADPGGVGPSVEIGTYRLGIGPAVGMSIATGPEAAATADARQQELARAIAQDQKNERKRRDAVDIVESSSDRAEAVTGQVERADTLWKEIAAGHLDVGAVNGEIDSFLALLQKLDRSGRFDEQLRLARSLSRLLAAALRWLELLRSLRETLAAAERHGNKSARAWALHELGTLRLAGGDLLGSDRALSKAAELRKELGESRALAATERNLQVLCRTLRALMREGRMTERRGLRRFLRAPSSLVVVLFLMVFGAATVAIAASGWFSGGPAHAAVVPTVAQIVPGSGPGTGGTVVTITGTRLSNPSAVKFGHADGTNLRPISATQLRVTSPPGSGTVPVTVVTTHGQSAPGSSAQFEYYVPPTAHTITQVLPGTGPATGGTPVTITGTGLEHATSVTFGGTAGTALHAISDTRLQVTTPPGSGSVPVTVATPRGNSAPSSAARFTYTTVAAAPTISGVTPVTGSTAGGTIVTITGSGLSHAGSVTFGGNAGTRLSRISDKQVQVTSPPGSGTVPVVVTSPAGSSKATPMDQFTYTSDDAPPTITAVDLNSGPSAGGMVVTISGTGLARPRAVTFGSSNATNLHPISAMQLQVTTPAGSGTVPVTVYTAAGKSAPSRAASFTYTSAPPRIKEILPDTGSSGSTVTILGTGLATASSVAFGTAAGSNVHPNSDTSVTVTVPPSPSTGPCDASVPATVTAGGGTSNALKFLYACPPAG